MITLTEAVSRKQRRSMIVEKNKHAGRFAVLDSWRAVSILLVLACHMLPLGPSAWQLNAMAGPLGMSLFFTLSGFLITSNVLKDPSVSTFLVRRLARILPLAYLATLICLSIQNKPLDYYVSHWLFFMNYRTEYSTPLTSPFWSLCVEVHFYLLIAYLLAFYGRRGIFVLPILGLMITVGRIYVGVYTGNKTHERGDEILAGVSLALIYADQLGEFGRWVRARISAVPLGLLIILFMVSCHPVTGGFQYLRPYLGAAVVGHTLFVAPANSPWLASRPLRYLAEISYALYVIHPLGRYGWFASGTVVAKYLKLPVTLLVIFGLAHLSTFFYERHWIALGKFWTHRWSTESIRGSRLRIPITASARAARTLPSQPIPERVSA